VWCFGVFFFFFLLERLTGLVEAGVVLKRVQVTVVVVVVVVVVSVIAAGLGGLKE